MQFRHPELCNYYAAMPRLMEAAGVEPERQSDPIYRLMAMVDRFILSEWDAGGAMPMQGDPTWTPRSEELAEIIERIIAPEHRHGLREWYCDAQDMNPTAMAFRDWLEARIGEPLKHQQAVVGNPATRPESDFDRD